MFACGKQPGSFGQLLLQSPQWPGSSTGFTLLDLTICLDHPLNPPWSSWVCVWFLSQKRWNDDIKLLTLNYQNQNVQTVIAQYHLACSQILEAHDSPFESIWFITLKTTPTPAHQGEMKGKGLQHLQRGDWGQRDVGRFRHDLRTNLVNLVNLVHIGVMFQQSAVGWCFFGWLGVTRTLEKKWEPQMPITKEGDHSSPCTESLKKIQSYRKLAYVDIWLAMIIYADVIHTCVMCMWLCI